MNKKVMITLLAITILIASAIAYLLLRPDTSGDSAELLKDNVAKSPAKTKGEYKQYTEKAVQATTDTKILFFHAPWCPQCRAIETSIETDGVPAGVTVFKVDYDSNQSLRQRYDVTIQTTFVKIDNKGNKVESYVAYDEPHFDSVKRELLP